MDQAENNGGAVAVPGTESDVVSIGEVLVDASQVSAIVPFTNARNGNVSTILHLSGGSTFRVQEDPAEVAKTIGWA